jgi:chromosome segregation ATPase
MGQFGGERMEDARDAGRLLIQQDAQALRQRLDSAFRLPEVDGEEMEWVVEDEPAPAKQATPQPSLAASATRQARALEEAEAARDGEIANLKEAMRDLCTALNGIAREARQGSSATAEKIESLTDTLAIVAGQVAFQRQDAKHNQATLAKETEALAKRLDAGEAAYKEFGELKTSLETNRGEISKLQERMLSMDQAVLQGLAALQDSLSSLRQELQETNRRLTDMEDKEHVHAGRLDAAEQRAEQSSRREKLLATALGRVARVLQPEE